MTRRVNLMSQRACRREAVREVLGKWKWFSLVAMALLLTYAWSVSSRAGIMAEHCQALQSQYEPLRFMKERMQADKKELASLAQTHALPLVLAVHRSPLSLIHAVSSATAETQGGVFVENFAMQSQGRLADAANPNTPANLIAIQGIGESDEAVSLFVENLRKHELFAKAELKSTTAYEIEGRQVKRFHLECRL